MSFNNRLHILATSLEIKLSGDPERIESAYEATSALLRELFAQEMSASMRAASDPAAPKEPAAPSPTPPPASAQGAEHLAETRPVIHAPASVTVIAPQYKKVCALDRTEFHDGVLGSIIDAEKLARIYVDHESAEHARAWIPFGKTLWRELATKARRGDSGS